MSGSDVPEDPPPQTRFLVRRAQANDGEAWVGLARRVREVLALRLDRRDLPQGFDAGDIEQTVLIELVRSIDEFDAEAPDANFRGWVATILRRKLLDLHRRAAADKRGGGRERLFGDYENADGGPPSVADAKWVSQSVVMRRRETSDCVARQMLKLPEKYRDVLRLRDEEGLTFPKIMVQLGYNREVTVRSVYMRAKERQLELVRRCFEQEC